MTTIKSIRIIGMHNVEDRTYHFDHIMNYFVGPNGAGKSTILNAIQLALLGYIPGTAKQTSQIMKHANGPIMDVTLVLNKEGNDISIQRRWTNTGKSVKATVVITPAVYSEDYISSLVQQMETPVFNFNEFVGMTANKMKDWFIQYLPSSNQEINWREVLTNAVVNTAYYDKEIVEEMLSNPATKISGVDGVREMNAAIKSALSFKKSELSRQTATIQMLVHYDTDISGYDVANLQAENDEYQRRMEAVQNYQRAYKNNALLDNMSVPYSVNYDSIAEDPDYARYAAELSEIIKLDYSEEISVLSEAGMKIVYKIQTNDQAISGNGICPYTSTVCESIIQHIENLKDENVELNKQYTEMSAKCKELREKQSSLESRKRDLSMLIRQLEQEYRKKSENDKKKQSMYVEIPYVDPTWINVDYVNLINENNEKIGMALANQRYEEMNDVLVKQKFKTEMEIECLKIWEKLTGPNGMQSELSVAPFVDFANTITNNLKLTMGQNMKSAFHIQQAVNSFSFGVERDDGIYMPFDLLSSGEKCMYALALMMSLEQISSDDLKLIIVDDMFDHLDDNNIVNLFANLQESMGIQFIFAGVKDVQSPFTTKLTK